MVCTGIHRSCNLDLIKVFEGILTDQEDGYDMLLDNNVPLNPMNGIWNNISSNKIAMPNISQHWKKINKTLALNVNTILEIPYSAKRALRIVSLINFCTSTANHANDVILPYNTRKT